MELTIEGKFLHDGTIKQGCLGIDHGKIVAIKKILKSDNHINVSNNFIFPTGIDLHVHFRDPGFTYKEDFSTGSQAAAFGGIGCIFDMPNTYPQITNLQTIKEKIRIVSKKSYVDFGLYGAVSDENIARITDLSTLCNGFKIFLGSSTNSLQLSTHNLQVALMETNRTKKISLIHAEDSYCLKKYKNREKDLIDHLRSRPAVCEEIAIRNILLNSDNLTSPIHICHLSSYKGLDLLRKKPSNISVGVTPHHLFFDAHNLKNKQSFYKVNPPIRSKYDCDMLWYGINHKLIDILESDHAPHTEEEKNVGFNDAPSGLPGVETMYPLLLAAMKKEQITLTTLLKLLCERPAELVNLPKGKIEVGRDADFIVIDMKKTETISADKLHSKCKWTPFEGFQGIFPVMVFIRGERVIDDHQMLVKKGFGKFVGE